MVKSVEIKEEFEDSVNFIVLNLDLEFFLENEGVISKVYAASAMKKMSDDNYEKVIPELLSWAFRDCIVSFSNSSWKNILFILIR